MAEPNSTLCRFQFSVGTPTPYIVNGVLNAVLSLATVFGNVLVFLPIRDASSLHAPSKIGLCSLVLTDIGVGLISQPLFATFLVAKATAGFSSRVLCVCFGLLLLVASFLSCASLLILTLISVDRYIAVHCYVAYRQIVTVKRARVLVPCAWLLAALVGVIVFLWQERVYFPSVITITCACLLTITFAYLKIGLGLRHRTSDIHDEFELNARARKGTLARLDVARHAKCTLNMMWISFVLLLCYVPSLFTGIAILVLGYNAPLSCVFEFTITIAFFNSCLNPLLYCWRIPVVRLCVLQRIRGLCA